MISNFYIIYWHDTISCKVYNCPNTEKYQGNKIHNGRGEARYEFYWPDIFRIRTIVHCVTNLSWFCNQTSYLMFSIIRTMNLSWFWIHATMYLIFQFSMGYGICQGFISIFHLWLHFFFFILWQ
jgi:hypothetical protein